MHHLTCGNSSLLHSVNLIVFTLLLVYLILHISPHHSHHLHSHHLSLPGSVFHPRLPLVSDWFPLTHISHCVTSNCHVHWSVTGFLSLTSLTVWPPAAASIGRWLVSSHSHLSLCDLQLPRPLVSDWFPLTHISHCVTSSCHVHWSVTGFLSITHCVTSSCHVHWLVTGFLSLPSLTVRPPAAMSIGQRLVSTHSHLSLCDL